MAGCSICGGAKYSSVKVNQEGKGVKNTYTLSSGSTQPQEQRYDITAKPIKKKAVISDKG